MNLYILTENLPLFYNVLEILCNKGRAYNHAHLNLSNNFWLNISELFSTQCNPSLKGYFLNRDFNKSEKIEIKVCCERAYFWVSDVATVHRVWRNLISLCHCFFFFLIFLVEGDNLLRKKFAVSSLLPCQERNINYTKCTQTINDID